MFCERLITKDVPDVYVKIFYHDVIYGINVFNDMWSKRRHILHIGFNLEIKTMSIIPLFHVSRKGGNTYPIFRLTAPEIMMYDERFKLGLTQKDGSILVPCFLHKPEKVYTSITPPLRKGLEE